MDEEYLFMHILLTIYKRVHVLLVQPTLATLSRQSNRVYSERVSKYRNAMSVSHTNENTKKIFRVV